MLCPASPLMMLPSLRLGAALGWGGGLGSPVWAFRAFLP